MNGRYGEFQCDVCGMVFHDKKKLQGHKGGAHRRGITERQVPRCKGCNARLTKGENWPDWAVTQHNLICKVCKNKQNKKSYRNRIALRQNALKAKLNEKTSLTLEDIKRRMGRNG